MKVTNPEKYNFEPKQLLMNILNMYSNMGEEPKFVENVVKDSRSYSYEIFKKALDITNTPKKGITLSMSQQEKFVAFIKSLDE